MVKSLIMVGLLAVLMIPMVKATDITTCQTISAKGIYNLTADVNNWKNDCFNVTASDIILDCGNHIINGSSQTADSSGVNVSYTPTNVTIRNCMIMGFYYGIFVLDSNITSESVNSSYNLHGIYMNQLNTWSKQSFSNFTKMTLFKNSGYGFDSVTTTTNISITNSIISENGGVGYAGLLLQGERNIVTNVNSSYNSERNIILSGDTSNNIFKNITMKGNKMLLDGLVKNSAFYDMDLFSNSGMALEIANSCSNNFFENVNLSSTSAASFDLGFSLGCINNTFINTTFNRSKVYVESGYYNLGWKVKFNTSNTNRTVMQSAEIFGYNITGDSVLYGVTNSTGILQSYLLEFTNVTGVMNWHSNYTLYANKSGYNNISNITNITVLGNSEYLFLFSVFDTRKPLYYNVVPSVGASTTFIGSTQTHTFTASWIDDVNVIADIESNFSFGGTNYTSSISSGNITSVTLIGITVGSYNFSWCGTDKGNNTNCTENYTYIVYSNTGGGGGGGGGGQLLICGDGICSSSIGETNQSCPQDCSFVSQLPYTIGDGVCDTGKGETALISPSDCQIQIDLTSNRTALITLGIIVIGVFYIFLQDKKKSRKKSAWRPAVS